MAVDESLVDEACAGLGVTQVARLKDGGQKTVRVVDRAGEQLVLKVIQVGTTTPDALQRAAREVDLLNSIAHDHVVSVRSELFEVGEPPNGAAWLEEFLDGDDLEVHFASLWDWPESKRMMMEVAAGLSAMHEMRVTHRDLSPANVRKCNSGRYVVMDPGYARHELLPPITVLGHPGTYGYISPEHLQPPPLGPTIFSDVFCVAILGYQALTGAPPIPYQGDVADYADRLRSVTYEDIATARPDLDTDVAEFFRRALHRQPARRFRDGAAVYQTLEGIA